METQEMSQNVKPLTEKQQQAVRFLVDGGQCKEVAKRLKVRPETVSRWKRLSGFQAACDRLIEDDKKAFLRSREEMRANLQHEITVMANDAINSIHNHLTGYGERESRAEMGLAVLKFLKADALWAGSGSEPKDGR